MFSLGCGMKLGWFFCFICLASELRDTVLIKLALRACSRSCFPADKLEAYWGEGEGDCFPSGDSFPAWS